jgi:hypothetical protein
MGSMPDSKLNKWDKAVFDKVMGKKYLEIIGEEVPRAWASADGAKKEKELLKNSKNKYAKNRGYELPRGWRVSYGEEKDKRYGYGMATDWAYKQYGIYSITTELWNPKSDLKNFPEIKGKGQYIRYQRELLKYQDIHYQGKLFVNWRKYEHPKYGNGEIGGWKPGYKNNAFPGEPLMVVCEKHWQYELFRAKLLPSIKITDLKTKVIYQTEKKLKYRVVEITAKIENKGELATNVSEGLTLPCNRDDVIWLIGDRDKITFLQGTPFQKLGVLEGQMRIPGFFGQKIKPAGKNRFRRWQRSNPYEMRKIKTRNLKMEKKLKQKGSIRTVKWLIRVRGDAELKVVFTSLKGGTVVKKIRMDR